jgi:hypothetical protein
VFEKEQKKQKKQTKQTKLKKQQKQTKQTKQKKQQNKIVLINTLLTYTSTQRLAGTFLDTNKIKLSKCFLFL